MAAPKKYAIPREQLRQLLPAMGGCLATDRILVDGEPIRFMYRVVPNPNQPLDNGWRFFAGDETDAYLADPDHTAIYALNTVANFDLDILPYLNTPAPCAFEKIPGGHAYRPVDPPLEGA
jgi:hypothetical protein